MAQYQTNFAIIGCGYVADFYAATLKNYPNLSLKGVYDKDEKRARRFSDLYKTTYYSSIEEILRDDNIKIIVNLTNIDQHYHVTKLCLEGNKHVYSEKPYALTLKEALELKTIAENKKLYLASAPCSLLAAPAQVLQYLIKENIIGKIYLAYAELDDGPTFKMDYKNWLSLSGLPWPYEEEFKMGCVIEHAAYYLSWLVSFFGKATHVTSYSTSLVKNELLKPTHLNGTDFSVACITFSSGVIARLTCSTIAPKDHSLRIIGEEGVITLEDCWDYNSKIFIQKYYNYKSEKSSNAHLQLSDKQEYSIPVSSEQHASYNDIHSMDFCKGLNELAYAIQSQTSCKLSIEEAYHTLEIINAIEEERGNFSCLL